MDQAQINKVEEIIKIKFTNLEILRKAFIHRSYLNETDNVGESNERLEFLGDSILQFLSSEMLYNTYPEFSEGELTNLRSKLVNTNSLAEESARLGYSEFLLISRGEKQTASESKHILANTFESVLGAIYLEHGVEVCREFLKRELFYKTNEILKSGLLKDFKSMFQEFAQEKFSITPTYKVVSEEGPDHQKNFNVAVVVDKKKIAEGTGSSKRNAQQEAAKKALELYDQLPKSQ